MSDIHWAGDSTVKFNHFNTFPQTGIGQVMALYLNLDVTVYNYAENGRSTKSFIAEGRLKEIENRINSEDMLFIQFGHNDQKEDVERFTAPLGAYQDNLRIFIESARRKGAFPVLITPLYRRHFDDRGVLMENVHIGYQEAMIATAQKEGTPYIDLCAKSKELLHKMGDLDSRKWFMHLEPGEYGNYEEGLIDDTHLKYEGAVVMAGLVAEGLKELGGRYQKLLLSV